MAIVTGGEKIKKFFADLAYNFQANPTIEAGFFDGSGYEDGMSYSEVARIQEYGTDTIPARPFMRINTQKNHEKWKDTLVSGIKWYKFNARAAVEDVGKMMVTDMQDVIRSNIPPPNAPSTLKKKKSRSTQTLIDTGELLHAVKYRVIEK